MHELSVCQSVISQVEQVARAHDATGVSLVQLSIGPLSGVEPALLAQAFPIAQAGTLAEGAVLELESLPIRVRCRSCGAETDAAANRLLCGACGDWQTTIISGDELLLTRVELIATLKPDTAEESAHV
ncbi:MAG TPA: hydrogenase maturation nickel metallochaperone HypA [Thioalkalivibrio sp.]|nr:hydrogenase maturation nickel metallochaperone HypA [Thioalkalivibrio sp.]